MGAGFDGAPGPACKADEEIGGRGSFGVASGLEALDDEADEADEERGVGCAIFGCRGGIPSTWEADMEGSVREGSCGVAFTDDCAPPAGGALSEGIMLASVFAGDEAGIEGKDNGRGWV